MAKSKKYYVVWVGETPGIYDDWTKTQQQIKGYPNAKYKSFKTRAAAEMAYSGNYADYTERSKSSKTAKPVLDLLSPEERARIVWDSISVDAACGGNPGKMEYQGVDTKTGARIFYNAFPLGTNNIGEFLALVHALAMLDQQGKTTPIYTDSRIAMSWVKQKKCKTSLKKNRSTAYLYSLIERAEKWLQTHAFSNPILKWDTKNWGEIPADFGRK